MSPDSSNDASSVLFEKLRSPWHSDADPDWNIVELLATMCNKAYLPPEEADEAFRLLGGEHVKPIAIKSMAGYLVSKGDITVIVFRGTDDPADWLVNLDCRTTQTQHGTIHRGFYEIYSSADPPTPSLKFQIQSILKEWAPKHLWITGHSLGGALALICAYDLIEQAEQAEQATFPISGLLTFGQPMVVQKPLAEYLNKNERLAGRYTYFVNGKDVIPLVPPSYVHCGVGIWLQEDSFQRVLPIRSEVRTPALLEPLKELASKDVPGPLSEQEASLVPLSEEQFEQLKASLRGRKTISRGASVKGYLPWIRDHSLEQYLEHIRRFHQNGETKAP